MKTHFCRIFLSLVFLAVSLEPGRAVQTSGADWNLAVLDQIIASASTGADTVQIGDMMIPLGYLQTWRNKLAGVPQPKSAFYNGFIPWTSGNVYYAFDASVVATNQKVFLDCAAEWATFANLHFFLRTTQANYILVTNNPSLGGGLSAVGMSGGAQLLQIGPGSWDHSVVCHELGHALGLCHEHQRSDRDSFVTINTNNIISGHLADFVLLTATQNKGAYDFLSVMHYRRNAFSVDVNSNTIQTLPAYNQYLNVMGQQFDPVLSTNDRAGMISIYGAGPGATNIVTTTQDSGPGSLRAALYYAYDHPSTTITFNIPTTDPGFSNNVFNILPTDALPSLVNATTLDGSSEPTNSNPSGPEILLNGALSRPPNVYSSGIYLKGTNCTVRSLTINNFVNFGILITGSGAMNNTVSGCYLGVDSTGIFAVTNGLLPLQIEAGASGNTIGGSTAAARNIIGGSVYQGLVMRDVGTSFNAVKGNYIGVNATGAATLANAWSGIEIYGGASSNSIGGANAGEGNVVSGNGNYGIAFSATGVNGNLILGNYIGLNAAGTAALPNTYAGVAIYGGAEANTVGGFSTVARNVISGNANDGVLITGVTSTGNTVAGNYIGLNPAGTSALPNGWTGVDMQGSTANNTVASNVISGNLNHGVYVVSSFNSIWGNTIGLNSAGTAALGNTWTGVSLQGGSANNTVASNLISANGNYGVYVNGNFNSVSGNVIGLNAVGTAPLGNAYAGVGIFSSAQSNLVGGVTRSARNVISGNKSQGIVLSGSPVSQNLIQGNYVGLNVTGTAAVSNAFSGIQISSGASANTIGGAGGARNFISGNGNYGIYINASGANVIQGNTVGLNGTNGAAVPNAFAGVIVFGGAQSNLVGGTASGAANLISGNSGDGVLVSDTATTNNTIRGNSIFSNAGNAIGLYNTGNRNLAAPSLSTVVVGTNTLITGSYNGVNGTVYQLDFYSDTVVSGAESMIYLGSRSFTGTGSLANFTNGFGALVPAGRGVTVSATDPAGNTSALSAGSIARMTSTPNDGIPDSWRAFYFGGSGTTTNSSSYAAGDPDHDGVSNLNEFLAGTNPTNAASVFKLTAQNPVATPNAVVVNSANGVVYRVFARDDLTAGNWDILADQVIGNGTNVFLADPAASVSTKRFYRAQVLW